MKPNTTHVLSALVVCANLLCAASPAAAQEKFPSRPIEIIVPTPPGGGTDITARLLAELVEPMLGQKVVVVNKAGAGGTLGMSAVVQAKPDGYTLGGLWNAPLTMTPHSQAVPYSLQDYVAISLADTAPALLCTKPDFPANTGKEFIEVIRSNPNKYTYGNDGVVGMLHLSTERIFTKLGIKARPVPFGGAGETLKNFLGGHVDIYAGSIPPIVPHVKAGAAKCLLLTSKEKNAAVPQAASLSELGIPETATYLWHGIVGPKGIPPDRIAILEKAFARAAKSDKFRQLMEAKGVTVEGSGAAEFRKLIDTEFKAMGEVVTSLGMAKK
ncbi:MAG: tripartite tricarboxylate transporter substrate binding protein [Betaproteobacteria bacterium]|nr:tripartite tricarboxylate transporter substrate binding protein [Betaproteobacteria bacterium]MBI2225638.1 tripartite tricarboxylate transporter substrate binding protein [Betaproteobacteria bacterium]MBI3053464.1 tripartite tricarboxylate transporter substrate binding protein [Betaproteobacteria bacterium]